MRAKPILHTGMMMAAACTILMAKDFWEKPYQQWKKNEAFKMKDNSPWAKSQTFTSQTAGRGSSQDRAGRETSDREQFNIVTVRFISALPVRHAYVRIAQLMNNYDAKTDAEKAEIDAKLSGPLKFDFSKTIWVGIEFQSNEPRTRMDVARFLEQVKADHLKQSCYLISDRLGRVSVQEYYPPGPDGFGAKFIFPRSVGDKPVVSPEDKEITFDMGMDPIGQRVFIRFKVKELMYGGELAY